MPVTFQRRAAFTLIELLTVMAIILILAGLILGIAGHAQNKAARARAESEMRAMENALENYKTDNGAYVRTANTDALNANNGASPPPDQTTYTAACIDLYQKLSGYGTTTDSTGATVFNKSYMSFTPGQLFTGSAAPGPTTYIIDPFGFCYGYSTAGAAAMDTANANGTIVDASKGFNPNYDLWCTAGYSSVGQPYPSNLTTSAQRATVWVKNW